MAMGLCRAATWVALGFVLVGAVAVGCADVGQPAGAEPQPPDVGRDVPAATEAIPRPRLKPLMITCDAGLAISARRDTTPCAFARNVFYGYWLADNNPGVFVGEPGIPAYSAGLGQVRYVECTGSDVITCRADRRGVVSFPIDSVWSFERADAIAYALVNDIGPVPVPEPENVTDGYDEVAPLVDVPEDVAGDEADCHPSYVGACLDPAAWDYDCEDGSGDGPLYTGRVGVIGPDEFSLDRDGDGVGCD